MPRQNVNLKGERSYMDYVRAARQERLHEQFRASRPSEEDNLDLRSNTGAVPNNDDGLFDQPADTPETDGRSR